MGFIKTTITDQPVGRDKKAIVISITITEDIRIIYCIFYSILLWINFGWLNSSNSSHAKNKKNLIFNEQIVAYIFDIHP